MKTAKKILALLLVAVMALSVLIACAPADTGESTPKGDPVTLVVRTRNTAANEDFDTVLAYVNELLEEKINVNIELQLYANTTEMNTQNDLDFAAGTAVDLVWMNSSTYASYTNEEALLPLNELLETYAPGLKESMSENYWNALDIDGEVYAVPNQQIAVSHKAMLVQKKYADEYGKLPDHITSMDVVEDFADWLVANHPDVYAFKTSSMDAYYSLAENANEAVSGASMLRIEYDNPTEVVQDIWHEFYKPTGRIYEEIQKGWIHPGVASGVDLSADLLAGKFVCLFDTNRPGIETEYQARYGGGNVEWIRIPVGDAYTTSKSLTSTLFGIPYTSKNPEKAVELLNLLHTDKELFNALAFGIEGVHYDKVSDNKVAVKENSGWGGYTATWALGNSFLAYAYGDQPEDLAEETKAINASAEMSPIDGFSFKTTGWEDVIANVSAIRSEYNNCHMYENSAELYDAYIAKLEAANIQGLIDACQEQLDAYWAEKNK